MKQEAKIQQTSSSSSGKTTPSLDLAASRLVKTNMHGLWKIENILNTKDCVF